MAEAIRPAMQACSLSLYGTYSTHRQDIEACVVVKESIWHMSYNGDYSVKLNDYVYIIP